MTSLTSKKKFKKHVELNRNLIWHSKSGDVAIKDMDTNHIKRAIASVYPTSFDCCLNQRVSALKMELKLRKAVHKIYAPMKVRMNGEITNNLIHVDNTDWDIISPQFFNKVIPWLDSIRWESPSLSLDDAKDLIKAFKNSELVGADLPF